MSRARSRGATAAAAAAAASANPSSSPVSTRHATPDPVNVLSPELMAKFMSAVTALESDLRKAHEVSLTVEEPTVDLDDARADVPDNYRDLIGDKNDEDEEAKQELIRKADELIPQLEAEIEVRDKEEQLLMSALEHATTLMALKNEADSVVAAAVSTHQQGPAAKKRKYNKRGASGSSNAQGSSFSPSAANSLSVGAQVAFRLSGSSSTTHGKGVPGSNGSGGGGGPRGIGGEEEWIQCEVIRVITEGSKYEVQDPEPDENNNPGQRYKASVKDLIAVPPVGTVLQPLASRTQVLARYPETTTFYRAEVSSSTKIKCKLVFEGEEEEGKETEVERRLVLTLPK